MIRDFNKSVILTTQNSEAFLNYRYEPLDDSIYFNLIPIGTIPQNTLFINGIDVSNYLNTDPSFNYTLYLSNTGDPSIVSFHVYTRESNDFDAIIRIQLTGDVSAVHDVSILNRPSVYTSINIYETSNIQDENEASYLILRSNPKFTGNIKLVVDSSNNLYLDTFKVSDILNNKKYRKQPISGKSIFSGDIRNTFSTLPLGEIYRLGSGDPLNISLPKTDLFNQFDLTYSYGARLLEDDLYPDSYSILAPLWINSKLPDYFVIFRLNGVYNHETYVDNPDLSTLANNFLINSELIKSWDIKNESVLGYYLQNHLNELTNLRSPLFLSLGEDPNTWYGIAIDKGIITGRSETPYFFDQKNNTTDINAFISQGYERLNLLCPNLLNIEFTFNDDDVSLYTMSRYFGLYLTENELYEFSYYSEESDSSIQILSLDGNDSSGFFISSIFDSSGYISDTYTNRIFVINDNVSLKRITNVDEINGLNKDNISQWLNKPGEYLFSSKVLEKNLNKFITINLKNLLIQGEHLRILDKTNFKIWEVYGINSDLLVAGQCWPYASAYKSSDNYPTIYRTAFSTKGTKEDQITAIKNAFNVFSDYVSTPFRTTICKESNAQLSFEIEDWANNYNLWFQRLTAQTVYDPNEPSSTFNNAANYNDIIFYGVFEPSINDFERIEYDASYGPINFELYGDRMSLMINFYDFKSYKAYSFDASAASLFSDYNMYMDTDNRYRLITSFDISTNINRSFYYITDPHELDDKCLIKTIKQINTIKGIWNAYKTYPISISLMGINPVKDIDYTVYDSSLGFESEYKYNREDDIYTYSITSKTPFFINDRNSYEITEGTGTIYIKNNNQTFNITSDNFPFNTFEGSAYIVPNDVNVTVTYNTIDGSFNFKGYNTSSEENISNYYATTSNLKYGLTIPYVSKWVGLGSDCRNNEIKLLLDPSILDDVSTNFIPYENNFNDEISFPSFKYLTPSDKAWESYIYYDINDLIQYVENGIIYKYTFKDLMISKPYTDIFSKLIYSNNIVQSIKNRSSLTYYSDYKQSIDTIIGGLNFSFIIDEGAKNILNVKDWDKYRISFVSSPSKNKDSNYPIEVFINENTETILVVWYQGSDMINYNKRYSTYFGGKNLLYEDASIRYFQGFKNNDRFWSYIKTPFIVNNAAISTDIINLFDDKESYDSSICSPFNQLNWNFNGYIHSTFNAYGVNQVFSNSLEFLNRQYNTFTQNSVNYNYIRNSATYGNGIFNYSNTYMNNENIYKNKTCNLDLLQYFITINNIGYYIIRENLVYTNDFFVSPPLLITINDPRNYKGIYTYNGWFRPKFNNILNFNFNEDKTIINTVQSDFILSNTSLSGYNYIPQLWYNKVVQTITSQDVSTKNAIGYIEDFNVFKSLWDADYFILDSSTLVDGYNSSVELPSYFGSKLIKLPKELTLDTWEFTTAKYEYLNKNTITLSFNLTRKIINLFKSNSTFISNWAELTTSDNIINNYINNTILGFYNISKQQINISFYKKTYDGNRIAYVYNNTFEKYEQSNIDGDLLFINNEYYYNINVPVIPDLSWFISFTLFEK